MLCSCCLSGSGRWGEALIIREPAAPRQTAGDIVVMKQGRVVEADTADEIFAGAKEAYTRDLIDSVPGLGIELGATI
ncbi:hypothetical protein M0E87_07285 [Corynebacterium sp. CCM 9185]|uniref:Uncharacterized protein n=1 Tax=Corynebacterium marambiense TaxID=2765364 RepID=A0ABS0VXK9_9CORY|nr:hypothetical protein [Corynebacterium marambiense]MBI9000108.1 hypothetical protein [Corynebacterium marambiense]MCK7663462.1 hypothetical protein [Corynebacterium marambiense]